MSIKWKGGLENPTTPFLEGRKLSTNNTLDNISCASDIHRTVANMAAGKKKIRTQYPRLPNMVKWVITACD